MSESMVVLCVLLMTVPCVAIETLILFKVVKVEDKEESPVPDEEKERLDTPVEVVWPVSLAPLLRDVPLKTSISRTSVVPLNLYVT